MAAWPSQVLHARLEEDVQILGGITVIHLHGNIKFHAAHCVHQFHKPIQVDGDIEVNGIPHQVGHHILEVLYPSMERGIDLRAGLIHQRVSGHREHSDLLVGHIVGDQHDGIGIAADLVRQASKKV